MTKSTRARISVVSHEGTDTYVKFIFVYSMHIYVRPATFSAVAWINVLYLGILRHVVWCARFWIAAHRDPPNNGFRPALSLVHHVVHSGPRSGSHNPHESAPVFVWKGGHLKENWERTLNATT